MAVDIRVDGKWFPNAANYSVQEDATPVIASDTTGGVGQTTFTHPETRDTKLLIDGILSLTDGTQGVTQGIIRSLASSDKVATITADSRLAFLVADKVVPPFQGLLGTAITSYLALGGITAGIVIDPTLFNISVVLQGFKGDLWFYLAKVLAPVYKFEIALVSNNIVFRPWRLRDTQRHRDAQRQFGLDNSDLAQTVIVHYYDNKYQIGAAAYPAGGWNEDVPIYQVGASETLVVELDTSSSLTSVVQPVAVDFVGRFQTSASVYSVTGKDGLPVTAAQWRAGGGSIVAKIKDDTRTIEVTITGSRHEDLAPYQIAMSAGSSSNYSSLRLIGTGVFFDDKSVNILTGQSVVTAPQELGFELENEAVSNLAQAYDVGVWMAHRYSVPRMTVSVTTRGINRLGDNGNYRYPIVDEWNAEYAGLNLDQWNAVWAGKDVFTHDEYWYQKTANDFANQAFGNIVGARVYDDFGYYRVRTSTVQEGSVSYDAEWDTTLADLNDVWPNATVAEWNAVHGTRRLDKLVLRPLER